MPILTPRLASARRYLTFAEPLHRWRIAAGRCPSCGPTLFVAMRSNAFMTRCLRCRANAVTLALVPVMRQHFGERRDVRAYELSTFGVSLDWMRRRFREVTTSEFFPREQRGALIEGVLNQDVEQLTFADGTFDLTTSNGVFEHVNHDERGLRELHRVLRPGGALIMSVPLYDIPATRRLSQYRPDGTLEWLGTPEFHDSRRGGPMSAPVVWYHSRHDIVQRVKAAGFGRVSLVNVRLSPIQREACAVVYAVKG